MWQKRFFQLFEENTGNYILYRVKEGDGKPKGRIPVGKILDVLPYTAKKTEQRFKILIPNRTYYMKATSVDMRKRWEKAIRNSIKKMEQGGSMQDHKSLRSVEAIDTVMAMQEFLISINNGMKFLDTILSGDESFNKFAKHMGLTSYFDLACYAPLFEKLYREIYSNAKFSVEVKLENTSSIELAKEQFEKFLMIVEQRALSPNLKAADLEALVNKTAQKVLEIMAKYHSEAKKIGDESILNGIKLVEEFFTMVSEAQV
eukprot:CAMPEP_0197516378 /NCGR_PEP_ID=MMETSP1318-20131121/1276_1 /TAXON_ID=552666 /ORGANISM="Partenskyella glossopodia, Strain RCC365" /LENGTH=258 /DNA_ID=CAMNT_0043065095 /DNA_START=24 /DNA_END=800 /DNA_ORIENTATION=-